MLMGSAWMMMPSSTLAVRSTAFDDGGVVLAAGPATLSSLAPAAGPARAARRIYPYSVVPGGVADGAELARVVKSDKVVAAHYAQFKVGAARKVKVSKARAVYVSYRKGDKIYWTANKVILPAGETLLSDGVNEVRTRCANRISDIAQLPVAADEPSAEVLDSSTEEGVEVREVSSGADEGKGAGKGAGPLKTYNSGNLAGGPVLAMGTSKMESMESFGARLLSGSPYSMRSSRSAGAPALNAPPPSLYQAPQAPGSNGQPDTVLLAPPLGAGDTPPADPPSDGPAGSAPGPSGGNGETGTGTGAEDPAQSPTPPRFADDTAESELPSRQPVEPEIIETDIGKVWPPGPLPSLNTGDTPRASGKIPEPATAGLVIGTLAVLGLVRRRRAGTRAKAR